MGVMVIMWIFNFSVNQKPPFFATQHHFYAILFFHFNFFPPVSPQLNLPSNHKSLICFIYIQWRLSDYRQQVLGCSLTEDKFVLIRFSLELA